jgi:hypothetical protein
MLDNSWKFSLLIAALVCGQGAASGQALHLKSRTVYTGPASAVTDGDGKAEARVRSTATGPVHQIVQFDHLPGVADLNALLVAGFKIVGAVPDNAVMVIAPSAATVQADGVSWIGKLEVSDKLSPGLGKPASSVSHPDALK